MELRDYHDQVGLGLAAAMPCSLSSLGSAAICRLPVVSSRVQMKQAGALAGVVANGRPVSRPWPWGSRGSSWSRGSAVELQELFFLKSSVHFFKPYRDHKRYSCHPI